MHRNDNKIEHNYHDHSEEVGERYGRDTVERIGQQQSFPVRLHYVLSELEKEGLARKYRFRLDLLACPSLKRLQNSLLR